MIVNSYSDYKYVLRRFKPVKNKLLNKHSKAEDHFVELLREAKIPYWREKCNFRAGTRWCYYDFYLPMLRLYVEIDGSEHDTKEQKAIDAQKNKIASNRQRFILRIKNEDVLDMTYIDERILLNLAARYKAYETGKDKRIGKYLKTMLRVNRENHEKIENDVKENMGNFDESFDFNKPIYLYDANTGESYKFCQFTHVKFFTEFGWKRIWEMLNCEINYSKRNRFIVDWTQDGLDEKVRRTFDTFDEPKISELDAAFMRSLDLDDF